MQPPTSSCMHWILIFLEERGWDGRKAGCVPLCCSADTFGHLEIDFIKWVGLTLQDWAVCCILIMLTPILEPIRIRFTHFFVCFCQQHRRPCAASACMYNERESFFDPSYVVPHSGGTNRAKEQPAAFETKKYTSLLSRLDVCNIGTLFPHIFNWVWNS